MTLYAKGHEESSKQQTALQVHWFYGAHVLRSMGRLQDATLELQRALDLDPLSPVNNALMAYLSYARGEYDQAMAHQRRTVDLEPDWYFPHLLLAIAHSYRGDFAQAIEGESVSKTGQFSRIVKKSVRRRPSPA